MYCPHCGVQNAEATKFCRGCGADLRLVSQAVTKSLPLVIAQKVDDAIDRGRGGWRSHQMFRAENRRPYAQALMGLSSLFVVVWMLMLGHGDVSFAGGFLLVMSASLLLSSLYELWTRKRRSRQPEQPHSMHSAPTTRELEPYRDGPEDSVTESTTRRLKVSSVRATRDDSR